jgi:hypothetical protein
VPLSTILILDCRTVLWYILFSPSIYIRIVCFNMYYTSIDDNAFYSQKERKREHNTVGSNHFNSVNILLFSSPDHVISMECTALDFRCQCTQQKLQSICAVLTFDPQLNNILAFSVKDRYQLIYFICIKDFNAETITSLRFVFFLYLRLSASRKENYLPLCIYFWYQTDSEVPNTSIYSAVSLASPYYNYL